MGNIPATSSAAYTFERVNWEGRSIGSVPGIAGKLRWPLDRLGNLICRPRPLSSFVREKSIYPFFATIGRFDIKTGTSARTASAIRRKVALLSEFVADGSRISERITVPMIGFRWPSPNLNFLSIGAKSNWPRCGLCFSHDKPNAAPDAPESTRIGNWRCGDPDTFALLGDA